MICVGILTVRQEKIGLWQKLKKPVSLKEIFHTQVKVIVAEISLSAQECRRIPRWILRMLYRTGMRFLQKNGCDASAPDEMCASIFGIKNSGCQGIHSEIPVENFLTCFAYLKKMNKNPIPRHAYIRCSFETFPNEAFLEKICSQIDAWTFCVDDQERFSDFAELLCTDYGIYPSVSAKDCAIPEDAMVLDLDGKRLCIDEERMADGMELMLDLHGYQVNQDAFYKSLPLPWEGLVFGSWTKGKKRLTRQ